MTDDWRTGTADKLRSLILAADADMVEDVKWRKPSNPDGVPTFSCAGLICTLETFAKGASLEDPAGLFNASLDAGVRRALDVRQNDTVDEEAFVGLVRSAVAHNRS